MTDICATIRNNVTIIRETELRKGNSEFLFHIPTSTYQKITQELQLEANDVQQLALWIATSFKINREVFPFPNALTLSEAEDGYYLSCYLVEKDLLQQALQFAFSSNDIDINLEDYRKEPMFN